MTSSTDKPQHPLPEHHYLFAHLLRGLASAIVFLGAHLLGHFWLNHLAVCQLLGLRVCEAAPYPPELVSIINDTGWFRYSHFGVSLFFLISGFVIPFSLAKYSKTQFLITRFFRIYPTYWAAFFFALVALLLFHRGKLWIGTFDILAQLSLTRDLFWVPSLDAISWTLQIEIKFYLLCALFSGLLTSGKKMDLIALVVCTGLIGLILSETQLGMDNRVNQWTLSISWYGLAHACGNSAVYIVYMLIGTCFNWHCRNFLSTRQMTTLVIAFFLLFMLLWSRSDYQSQWYPGTFNYGLALIIFAVAYRFREQISAPPLFIWLGNISYPLYVVHLLPSYVLIYWLTYVKKFPAILAILLAGIIAISLALLLHRWVELPTNGFGKRLAKRMER
ncbi:acyltransferase family protein [Legionella quinlivanii]|uniref:acyltransferase family protein n=1 Tax=Legionella quinlivanii TaxID=45073 RepID=UPI0022433A9B|nr:acyltransferase [Legionella quinlivanii]MCW8452207.1 acyltransferase [Legionella quinlivanii]